MNGEERREERGEKRREETKVSLLYQTEMRYETPFFYYIIHVYMMAPLDCLPFRLPLMTLASLD